MAPETALSSERTHSRHPPDLWGAGVGLLGAGRGHQCHWAVAQLCRGHLNQQSTLSSVLEVGSSAASWGTIFTETPRKSSLFCCWAHACPRFSVPAGFPLTRSATCRPQPHPGMGLPTLSPFQGDTSPTGGPFLPPFQALREDGPVTNG